MENKLPNISLGGLKDWKPILTIVVLLGLLFIVWTMFVSKQYAKFSETRASSDLVKNELGTIDTDINQIKTLAEELAAVQEGDLAKLNKILPHGQNMEDYLASMHKIAQQSGMLITNMYVHAVEVSPDAVSQEADPLPAEVKKLEVTMTVKGNYKDLTSFLNTVERHARVMDIETLNIANAEGNSSSAVEVLTVNISASIYYLDVVPESPVFPYGTSLDLSLFEKEQFKLLQGITATLPSQGAPQPNPFAPR